jgi:hypothetical protein
VPSDVTTANLNRTCQHRQTVWAATANASCRLGGGRSWWAQPEFTRINIALTIVQKDIEDLMNVRGIGEKSFLKLKPLITVGPVKNDKPPASGSEPRSDSPR